MKGPALLLVVACTTLLACSLSGSSPDAGSPTEPVSGGGVPIAKSTPIPAESSPAATNPPEPATSAPSPIPTQAGSTPLASGQDIPVQVVDLNVVDFGEDTGVMLYGLVRNVGQQSLNYVQFTLNFLDRAGSVIGSRISLVDSSILPPGELGPFREFFPAGVEADADLVRIEIFWKEADSGYRWRRGGMEVVSASGSPIPRVGYQISGELRNNSSVRIGKFNLLMLTYDAAGHFLGYGSYGSEDGFDPGESFPFDRPVNLPDVAESVASYEFIVETLPEE